MKKNFIYVSMLAIAAGTTGIMFTSCNDDSEVVNEASAATVANQCNDAFVSLPMGQEGQKVAVRFEGTRAAVTTDVDNIGNTALNADVTFTDDSYGVISMSGDTFQKKNIPFMKSASTMALDFSQSSDFGGNTVILKKNGGSATLQTRALIEDGKFCSDDVITEDAQEAICNFGQALLKLGFKQFLGDFGESIADPILGYAFGSSDPNIKRFEDLEENLNKMNQRIIDLGNKMDQKDVAEAYRHHWEQINNLNSLNLLTYEVLQKHPELKKEKMDLYVRSSIDGYTLYSGLVNIIKKYSSAYDVNRNWYNVLDEFSFDAFPFESLGYGDRELTRAMDLKVLTDATNIMLEYYNMYDQTRGSKALTDALEVYYEFAKANQVKRDTTHIICQIPGAYLVMDTIAKNKVVGKGVYDSSNTKSGFELDPYKYQYQDRDGSWINSYVYSDQGINARKQEIKNACLSKDQAQAIVDYFKNRYGSKMTLGEILAGVGVKNFTNASKGQIMLSNGCNADWYNYTAAIFRSHSNAHITCTVWDNEKNAYNNSYLIDEIQFNNHKNAGGLLSLNWYTSYQFGNHTPDKNLDYVTVFQSWTDREKAIAKDGFKG